MKSFFTAILLSVFAFSAQAAFPGEQVWNASITNNQMTCGIDYAGGTPVEGGILTKGESGTSNSKAITFDIKANVQQVSWKITEAKLVQNTGRFNFDDNLLNVNDKDKTSIYINDQEYSWPDAAQNKQLQSGVKVVKLAPKINLDQDSFPMGTTRITGKIVVTCAN